MNTPLGPDITEWFFANRVSPPRDDHIGHAKASAANQRLWAWLVANPGQTPEPRDLTRIFTTPTPECPDPPSSET